MGQPATAAIIVGCIVGGVVFVFVAYKVYVKYYYHKHKTQIVLPPAREPQSYTSHPLSPSTNTMTGSLYGDAYNRDSWKGSHSRASISSHLDKHGSENNYPYHSQRRSSSQGLLGSAFNPDASAPNSPLSPSTDLSIGPSMPPSTLDNYEVNAHRKELSSSSSTMTLKRSYAPSVKSSGGMSSTPAYRRESYLPHLPENRDQIQITPPQPLGFGLGGMATAIDQKTLAFSTTSGIGSGEDDFTRGLVWQEGNPDAAAQLKAAKLGEEERLRYLAQGPVRTMSPGAMRGAIHNHVYSNSNAGSSGMRTPDVPSSRSRSPAQVAPWDGSSTSDVGPSVSQRGTIPPSQPPSHPLESSYSSQSLNSQTARNAAFTSQQSPLGLMSEGIPSHPLASTGTSNSPILSAFRNPVQPHPMHPVISSAEFTSHSHSNSANSGSANSGYNHGERTPGMMSESVSTENGSGSAPMTDSSGRQSATEPRVSHNGFLVDEEKRIAIGKDGQLKVMGGEEVNSPEPNSDDRRQSKGWRLGRMLGSRA